MVFNAVGAVRSFVPRRGWRLMMLGLAFGIGVSACRDGETGALISVVEAGTIEGTVRDDLGAGLSGLMLTLSDGFGEARTTVTDGTGSFRFTQVDPGTWFLSLAAPSGFVAAPGQALERQLDVAATGIVRADFRLDRS